MSVNSASFLARRGLKREGTEDERCERCARFAPCTLKTRPEDFGRLLRASLSLPLVRKNPLINLSNACLATTFLPTDQQVLIA